MSAAEMVSYRESGSLYGWVKISLYAQVVVALVSIWSSAMEYQLLTGMQSGAYTADTSSALLRLAESNDARQGIVAMIYIVVFVVSGFLILRWIHRANVNARALGAKEMKFTPGWSIGWYFIPIFNLWKPYQAIKEIWKASVNPLSWQSQKAPALLAWWWFVWLIAGFLGNAAFRISAKSESLGALVFANVMNQASDVVGLALSIIFLLIVKKIQEMQDAHRNSAMAIQ